MEQGQGHGLGLEPPAWVGLLLQEVSRALLLLEVWSLLRLGVSLATCSVTGWVGKAGCLLACSGPRFQPQPFWVELWGRLWGAVNWGIPQEVGEGKGIETLGWGLEAAWW